MRPLSPATGRPGHGQTGGATRTFRPRAPVDLGVLRPSIEHFGPHMPNNSKINLGLGTHAGPGTGQPAVERGSGETSALAVEGPADAVAQLRRAAQVIRGDPDAFPAIVAQDLVARDVGGPALPGGAMDVALVLDGDFQVPVGEVGPPDPLAVMVAHVGI